MSSWRTLAGPHPSPGADRAVTAAEIRLGLGARPAAPRSHAGDAPDVLICAYSGEGLQGIGADTGCHHCRLAAMGRLLGVGDHTTVLQTARYGYEVGDVVMMSEALRHAAEEHDDVAVLRALDQWEASR